MQWKRKEINLPHIEKHKMQRQARPRGTFGASNGVLARDPADSRPPVP